MSETIPQRLRRYIPLASYDGAVLANIALFAEAAAEIDRLTEENVRLREVLEHISASLEMDGYLAFAISLPRGALPKATT
jgi:hypothetical protein